MSGHVFVVGADLTQLACDDVVVPTDRGLQVDAGWLPLLPPSAVADPAPPPDEDGHAAVRVGGSWSGGGRVLWLEGSTDPRTWLVDTVGDEGLGLEWLLEGARQVLDAVAQLRPEPRHGRARRLVALPALGTGWGVAAGSRGVLLERLLPVLRSAAEQHGYDVALVLRDPRDLAAAQQVRRAGQGHWDLTPALLEVGERLGVLGRRGELAVFVGAGVSAAAGLPTWAQLLEELAELCDLEPELRAGLVTLPPQDSGALLARELGQERLAAYLSERFADRPCTLAHAALATLPVQELVTTNYDRLLERAAAGAHRPLTVLPFQEAEPGRPWLLKLHGDVGRPDSVVLTREQYLRTGDHRAALAGVLHTLLLTRHLLFVGSSMVDDDLIRIAAEVRSALDTLGPASGRRLGTVLALREDPVRARLWSRDVDTVAVGEGEEGTAEAARRLEVLLDLVGCLSCPPTGYLLDPAYRGMLDEDEAALARALAHLDDEVHERPRRSWAWEQLDDVLQRLGAHSG
jgi:hypothetical protein